MTNLTQSKFNVTTSPAATIAKRKSEAARLIGQAGDLGHYVETLKHLTGELG